MLRKAVVLLGLCLLIIVGAASGVTAQAPTSAPTPIAPLGALSLERMPTFEWYAVSDATWYYLWLSYPGGQGVSQWYDGGNICQMGICAVTPGIVIQAGLYRWWVQAWSPQGGYSLWSSEAQFTVITPTPTPAAPAGTISMSQPTFQWYEAPGASWYYLWISGDGGHVLDQWFTAAGSCVSGLCSVAPISLPAGNYRWWVEAWQEQGGYGAWSGQTDFAIAAASPISEVSVPEIPASEAMPPESAPGG